MKRFFWQKFPQVHYVFVVLAILALLKGAFVACCALLRWFGAL